MTLRSLAARLLLTAAAAGAMAGSTLAGQFKEFEDNCGTAPYAPDIKTDVALPDDKIAELRKDVLAFIKASDQFQECMSRLIDQGPEFKKSDDTPEKRMAVAKRFQIEGEKIVDENQSEKERVGTDFNKLVDLSKSANKPK